MNSQEVFYLIWTNKLNINLFISVKWQSWLDPTDFELGDKSFFQVLLDY